MCGRMKSVWKDYYLSDAHMGLENKYHVEVFEYFRRFKCYYYIIVQ